MALDAVIRLREVAIGKQLIDICMSDDFDEGKLLEMERLLLFQAILEFLT